MPVVVEPSWVGRRVTIRRTAGPGPDGRPRWSDVVGHLLDLDGTTATVATSAGTVAIGLDEVTAAKPAPPSTRDELDLEAVAARGWRAAESAQLGGWLLRANGGFTGRANSVLPLAAPGRPLAEALHEAGAWYATHGLPTLIQVPVQARRLLDAALAEQGWLADPLVHVFTRRLDVAWSATATAAPVALETEPDDAWLHAYRDGAGASPAGHALLTRHDQVRFAAVRDGDRLLAIGRGVVDDGWLGVSAVHVAGEARRRGLATAVVTALVGWARTVGAGRSYLQVSAANTAGVGLWNALGYHWHHDYHYRREP